MQRILPAIVLSLSAASGFLFAQTPGNEPLTINQAVEEAIRNNPGLMAERLGIPVAQTAVITAGLRPNPVASYAADYVGHGTALNQLENTSPPDFSFRVDYPWERGHKRELRLDAAAYQRRIAELRVLDFVRRLRLDVTLACIDLIEAKARVTLANDSLKSLDGIVNLNETRLRAGAIAPLELTRSRVAMLQFRANVKTAELALVTARSRLQTLLGRKTADVMIDLDEGLHAPLPQIGPNLAALRDVAIASRPDIRAIQQDQARSQADLRLQVAQGKVDYTFGSQYHVTQGITHPISSVGFFFSVPIPVYNRNQGEIARARAEQSQLGKSLEALQAQVTGEVTTAYQEFESARQLVTEIERDLIKPSEDARDTTRYVYQAGASSLLEVLDAQRAFNETMSTYYGAQADFRRASTKLASVVGEGTGQEAIQ